MCKGNAFVYGMGKSFYLGQVWCRKSLISYGKGLMDKTFLGSGSTQTTKKNLACQTLVQCSYYRLC